MCPQFRGVAVASHVHNVVALREIPETLNPALKLGRGNGGFRERKEFGIEVPEAYERTTSSQRRLIGCPAARGSAGSVLQSPYQGNLIE